MKTNAEKNQFSFKHTVRLLSKDATIRALAEAARSGDRLARIIFEDRVKDLVDNVPNGYQSFVFCAVCQTIRS